MLALTTAVSNLFNIIPIFDDFPGLKNEILQFHDFPGFLLATYMRRMRNNNLEIRIAGSSCGPQYINKSIGACLLIVSV